MKLCVHQTSTADMPWGKCPTHSQWKTVLHIPVIHGTQMQGFLWHPAPVSYYFLSDTSHLYTASLTSRWLWSSCKCKSVCVCVMCNPWTSATADVDFMPSCLLLTFFTSDLLLFVPLVRHLNKPTGGWFPPFSGSPHSLMAQKGIFVDILFYWLPL